MMSRMQASIKFYYLKMKEYELVDQFVAQFRLLRLKLAQTDTLLSSEDACMRFLSALPPSYAGFVTSQNAVLRLTQQIVDVIGSSIKNIQTCPESKGTDWRLDARGSESCTAEIRA